MQRAVGAAGALAACAVAAHAVWVVRERRRRTARGRGLQFVPGSADTALASALKAGDVVRFDRDCSLTAALDCASCVARRHAAMPAADDTRGNAFGVIVIRAGEPYVGELGYRGFTLSPFERRVQASLSRRVVILPLAAPLAETEAATLARLAMERAARDDRAARPVDTAAAPPPRFDFRFWRHPLWDEVLHGWLGFSPVRFPEGVAGSPAAPGERAEIDARDASLAAIQLLLHEAAGRRIDAAAFRAPLPSTGLKRLTMGRDASPPFRPPVVVRDTPGF